MECDVLNLEWSSSGRDREAANLVCYALREKGYSVVEASIFNYKHYLLKYKPRLLYAADPSGARINAEAVKFAHKLGIPVVCLVAEGNYTVQKVKDVFWGHIYDKQFTMQLKLLWSARTRKMVLEHIGASLVDRVKVSGGIGFDRYQIYQFHTKEDWMKKYNRVYKHMVGYASFAFDFFYPSRGPSFKRTEQIYGKEQVEQFRQERLVVNDILRKLIERNTDTLFILKEGPAVHDPSRAELMGLSAYPNVIHIKNEEAIADCINACDIWMAFDSTTCLEAWLLGKPTLLLNPFGGDFVRSNLHRGSLILRTFEKIQNSLDTYFESGTIPEFETKCEVREKIIQETIQWADGKNHMRAAYLIDKMLAELPRRNIHITLSDKFGAVFQNILFNVGSFFPSLPKFRTYAAARERFQKSELEQLIQRYEPFLKSFYQKNPLTEWDIDELERINGSPNQG